MNKTKTRIGNVKLRDCNNTRGFAGGLAEKVRSE